VRLVIDLVLELISNIDFSQFAEVFAPDFSNQIFFFVNSLQILTGDKSVATLQRCNMQHATLTQQKRNVLATWAHLVYFVI
jgi:hypothetical protein